MIASAGEKKMELLAAIEKELVIEGLIKAQGFNDAVVTMRSPLISIAYLYGYFSIWQLKLQVYLLNQSTEQGTTNTCLAL